MNKKFTPYRMLRSAIVCLTILVMVACSNNGSNGSVNNDNNGDVNTLQLTTPTIIYSNPMVANIAYVVINNPTNTTIKNLHYSLKNLIGGATGAQIEPISAMNCGVIEPHSQCNLKLSILAGAVAGSFSVAMDNDSSQSSFSAITTQAIGIQQSAYNNLSGADGITLNYSQTVITGEPYVLISGLVASANAGNFNNVVLVDSNNKLIPNQQLITEAGSYTQGKTFSILLSVPAGNNITQVIKAQTRLITPATSAQKKNLATTEIISTATTGSTLTTVNNIAIVEMLPSAIYLSQSNPEQSVTFSNIGNVTAQLQSLTTKNPNIEINFSSANLTSGTTITTTLKLKNPTLPATSGEIILTYFNGVQQISIAATADQNVNPAPTPTPIPTPTPSSTPTPQPVAGLTAELSPDNNFFVTTANDTTTKQLTITNTGNTIENNFVLTLPRNFNISDGSNPATKCTVTQPATINNTLAASGGNCTVTVTYTNSTVTAQAAGNISIAYDYNNGIAATPVTVGVNYKVTQSTANLTLSPSTMNYASIPNNAISTSIADALFTLSNSGEVAANNLAFNITGVNSSLFSVIAGGTCSSGGSLGTGSDTCTIATQFGPAANGTATGTKTANLTVEYTPYSGGATQNTNSATLNSEVTQAPSAIFTSTISADSFGGGDGSQNDPYLGNTNISYTLDVLYTNTSTVAATSFTTSYTPPTGWTLTAHGCDNANIPANTGNCTDTYTLNSANAGSNNLLLQNVTASWTDSSGSYTTVAMPGSEMYVSLTSPPAPPAITIDNLQGDATNVMGISPITFTATISGSGTSTLSATLSNSVTGTIVSNPSPCALDLSGTTSCSFTIISWYTGFDNSTVGLPSYDPYIASGTEIALSATNGATISGTGVSGNSISYIITTPYIYLPAPQEGAASATNTGITWGAGGTVSSRFEVGTAANGSDCPSGQEVRVDNLTNLMWVQAPSSTTYRWVNAQTSPAIPTTYCGYTDWRLPTETELLSLVNYAAPNGDLAAWLITQGFTNIQGDNYWSATPMSNNISIWVLSMADGATYNVAKNGEGIYVWPVRSR